MSKLRLQSCHHQVLCIAEFIAVLAVLNCVHTCLHAFPTSLKELFPDIPSVEVDLRWLLTLQRGIHVFERLRLTHVQTPFLPSWYVRKAKGDVVLELLLLVLCGGVEEERSGAITNVLGNPLPLQSAGKLLFSNFLLSILLAFRKSCLCSGLAEDDISGN